MGGGQSLNFGLKHLDTFAWVGGFSSAPNTRPADELIADPAGAAKQLKLLWVSCGDQDGLMDLSRRSTTPWRRRRCRTSGTSIRAGTPGPSGRMTSISSPSGSSDEPIRAAPDFVSNGPWSWNRDDPAAGHDLATGLRDA